MSMFTQLVRGAWVKVGMCKITHASVNKRYNTVNLTMELTKGSSVVIDGSRIVVDDITTNRGDRVRLAIDADMSVKIEHERKRDRA